MGERLEVSQDHYSGLSLVLPVLSLHASCTRLGSAGLQTPALLMCLMLFSWLSCLRAYLCVSKVFCAQLTTGDLPNHCSRVGLCPPH